MHLSAFNASYPILELISSPDTYVDGIKTTFNRYWEMGYYKTTEQPVLLHHRIETATGTYNGLVSAIDLKDYLEGRIIPHENTIAELEQKQVNLLMNTGAQLKPVMLTYREVPAISNLLDRLAQSQPPLLRMRFESLDETHIFRPIGEGGGLRTLLQLFTQHVEKVYIADGHHRMAANVRLYCQRHCDPLSPFRWLPAALYAHTSVRIFEYNRVVRGLNGLRPAALVAKLSEHFSMHVLPAPALPHKPGMLTMYLDRQWFSMEWRTPLQEGQLDVTRLDQVVFSGILGITDIRTDPRVAYVEGIQPLERLMAKAQEADAVAFCLYPLDVQTFMSLCDRGQLLPPKSTWFEPRIRSGLVVRRIL